jgi:hypothetical protein
MVTRTRLVDHGSRAAYPSGGASVPSYLGGMLRFIRTCCISWSQQEELSPTRTDFL